MLSMLRITVLKNYLAGLINDIYNMIDAKIKEKRLNFIINIDENIPEVAADKAIQKSPFEVI